MRLIMRMQILLPLVWMLFSCSHGPQEPAPAIQEQQKSMPKNELKHSPPKMTAVPKTDNVATNMQSWKQYSEEDREIERAIDDAITHGVARMLKRAYILTIQQDHPIGIRFANNEQGHGSIIVFKLLSKPGTNPITVGEQLETYQLSPQVKFQYPLRYFWYDRNGRINFFGSDHTMRIFDNPPRGEIVILPVTANNPRRGVIDVIRGSRGQLKFHQFILIKK